MNYLLDTNACIALMTGPGNLVQTRFVRAAHKGDGIFTSVIVAFELWYGVFKSAHVVENTRRYEKFFAGPIGMIDLEEADGKIAGELRASLEAASSPIGAYDLLIAGQAMRHKMTLITANTSEFSRIKGLAWEDWSK